MRTSLVEVGIALGLRDAEAEPSEATSASCYDQIEYVRILPVIKSELEFVQVQGQISLADFVVAAVAAHDTALQERPERFNRVSVCGAHHVFALAVANHAMIVIMSEQAIAAVLIGREQFDASAIRYLADKAIQRRRVGVLDDLANHVALARDRADDGNLSLGARQVQCTSLAGVHILSFAAYESFINFDLAAERDRALFLHRSTNARAHIPSRLIRSGAHHAMNLVSGNAFLRVAHDEHHLEPRSERIFGVLKDGLGDDAESVAIAPTAFLAFAYPMEGPMRDVEHLWALAARAFNYAVRPSVLYQKALAIVLGLELIKQLIERSHRRKYRTFYVWCQHADNPLP